MFLLYAGQDHSLAGPSQPILAELLKNLSFFWMQSMVPCFRLPSAQTLGTTPPSSDVDSAASAMEHWDFRPLLRETPRFLSRLPGLFCLDVVRICLSVGSYR